MSTVGWLFIFTAIYLVRAAVKGQLFSSDGQFVLFENTEKLMTAVITGDEKTLKELDQQGPVGLNAPLPPTGQGAGSSFDPDAGSAGGGGGGGGSSWSLNLDSASSWDKLNERTVSEAVNWALSTHSYPSGYCERMVTVAYRGRSGGFPTAIAHAHAMRLYQGTPPAGALVFWKSGNPAGHVALSVGGGQVVSTDFDGEKYAAGKMSRGPLTAIDKWGPRLGWSAPVFK